MEFKNFNEQIQVQFAKMCQTGMLFKADVSGSELWEMYLSSFKNDRKFRDPNSSTHNCNLCHNFIRRYGNIISVNEDGTFETLFSEVKDVDEYDAPAAALDALIKSRQIKDVFFETYKELNLNLNYESCNKTQKTYKLGIETNYKQYTQVEVEVFGVVNTKDIYEFNHFFIELPRKFVDFSGDSIESVTAKYRDRYPVFGRAMEEISLDTLKLVKDLINQGSLLDGTSHLHAIDEMIAYKVKFDARGDFPSDVWLWVAIYDMSERVAKFRNNVIGTLCVELTEGKELNKACVSWNERVDPINFHKATAPITKKQIDDAQKFVAENGYLESFNRRLVNMNDINVSEIKHIATNNEIKSVTIFDDIKPTSTQHKRAEFDKLQEISIENFMKDVLPNCTSIQAYLENRMDGNLVVLTMANTQKAKSIFKWNNNYSWTFNGNLAGKSQIKKAVKGRGGNVDGVLNVRLYFPGTENDYDLHMKQPNRVDISYHNVRVRNSASGVLDLDAQGVDGAQTPENRVENITYSNLNKMPEGNYSVTVNDYSQGKFPAEFFIEIEYDGNITNLKYNSKHNSNNVAVATITLKNGQFTVVAGKDMEVTSSNTISKELWGLESNNFHKVNLICLSPNHWGNNKQGNLHYMFMLEGCGTPFDIRGFHNENLLPELLKYKKVMEVLGATSKIKPKGKHLAGLGFNSTVKDELIVKCAGSFKRMLKIKF